MASRMLRVLIPTQRLRDVFDDDFPLPERGPSFDEAAVVGGNLWVRAVGSRSDGTRVWYVLDPSQNRVAGRLAIPTDWGVLGGDEDTVLVLRRDAFDVEFLELYRVNRTP